MELRMKGLPYDTDYYRARAAIARVFHSENSIFRHSANRPLNFGLELNYVGRNNPRTNGTGTLILPTVGVGERLLRHVNDGRIGVTVQSRPIRLFRSKRKPGNSLVQTLRKVPYQDPTIDKERDEKLQAVNRDFRVNSMQFGIWARRPTISNSRGLFCVEWDRSYTDNENAVIRIGYDQKMIRIKIGNVRLNNGAKDVLLKFSNIKDMWAGDNDGNPFLCFDMLTPAIFENSSLMEGSHKALQRIGFLDSEHAQISPYAHQIRVTLDQPDGLDMFVSLCATAGLEFLGVRDGRRVQVDSEKHEYFTREKLSQVEKLLAGESVSLSVAFQVEALLRLGLVHTNNILEDLWRPICDLYRDYPGLTADILKAYVQELSAHRPPFSDVLQIFRELCSRRLNAGFNSSSGSMNVMSCMHVTFTPTRMTLEGPYGDQSNRVIRKYAGYEDNFLRVDFRDEDRLHYRWSRQVDGETFLKERVGTILKEGFMLAGRRFEFLAYSSSSLRNHTVWFMLPFHSDTHGWVCAASIRKGLGEFDKIANLPAKCAARIALAFTATDPSVEVEDDKRTVIDDIKDSVGKEFTDGVGTMSKELNERIWAELCRERPDRRETELLPSAYQIRFLGFKGVLVVDELLKHHEMCLRESMLKFEGDASKPVIEIAQAFNKSKPMFLNRPLIMILEDRGVHREVFLDLQDKAVGETLKAYDSLQQLHKFVKLYSFCTEYKLAKTLQRLARTYKLDLNRAEPRKCLADPFLDHVVHTIVNSVLREIKHRARIRVPDSWTLVGVADEGVAYGGKPGYENIFTLNQGEVFACIQDGLNSEEHYLRGQCIVSRNPTMHPGDVQLLRAIGKPPADRPCFFRNLKNCLVFPCKGTRSIPSGLAGGDLDGDEYNISVYHKLFPSNDHKSADYNSVPPHKIDPEEVKDPNTGAVDLERLIPHVCDFVVEYINSDVLGLLSSAHLIRADQSSLGVFDRGCMELAKLCSQAVDYPKNGVRVNLQSMPRRLTLYIPDWKEDEVEISRKTDFYTSERALGHMHRKIAKDAPAMKNLEPPRSAYTETYAAPSLENHPVYIALHCAVTDALSRKAKSLENLQEKVGRLFQCYADELRYICQMHTLTDHPDVILTEQEVFVGLILAQCPQRRWRYERIQRMRMHATTLTNDVRKELVKTEGPSSTKDGILAGLERAWEAWKFTVKSLARLGSSGSNENGRFGLNSYGYIALDVVLDCLERLE